MMGYGEPNSGLHGAKAKKVEASNRMKKPLTDADASRKRIEKERKDFKEAQRRLRQQHTTAEAMRRLHVETYPCCEHCTPSTCRDDGDGHLQPCVPCNKKGQSS